jgi:predicted Ser/Thr protein kinase
VASPTTILRSGEVLGGYRIDDVLGVGGMAVVYRAHQLSLNRPVALKVLTRDVTHDDSFLERFRREAHHAATLEHPNIVPVYDTGEDAGHLYIAMRLVEGGTLADLLQGGGLSPAGTVRILRPLARALDAAHGLGLVHRDIKPENILLARDEHPYLGDFGVAKSNETRGLTEAGGFVGTVNYASPEQIRAEPLTPASDIYSFTAMAFECLTGQVPYPKDTDAGVMQAHLVEPPPAIAVEGLSAATALQAVIARGMAKDPAERHPSATALVDAVEAAVATLPEGDRRRRAAFGGGGAADGAVPVPAPARGATRLVPRRIDLPDASAADAAQQARARLKQRGTLAAVVAVAVTLPLVAALRPAGGGGEEGPRVADGSFVAVRYAAPWVAQTAASPPLPGLDIDRPAALSTAGPAGEAAVVRAGRLLRPSRVSAGLPAGVAERFAEGRPRPVTVRVGNVVARRYDGVLTDARRLSLLVVATDRGDVAVACERPPAGPLPARLCDGILGSLRLVGARPLPPGPDPQLARGLDAALGPLAGARSQAALDDTSLVRRADNLRRLAAATTAAAASIRALTPRAADRPAVTRARAALAAEARALGSLADATLDRLHAAYGTASAEVEAAQRRLRDALRELGRRGYRFAATALP